MKFYFGAQICASYLSNKFSAFTDINLFKNLLKTKFKHYKILDFNIKYKYLDQFA